MIRGHAQSTIDLAAGHFAGLVQRHASDLVTGIHLIGSAVDGDFQPGQSDLDFVAVLSRVPTEVDLDALALVHRGYGADPTLPALDGVWLTEAELRAGPDAIDPGPTTASGNFLERARGNRNPVTWSSLQNSVSLLGELDRAALWQDRARLVEWGRENAESYWRRWLARASGPGLAMLGRAAPAWGVLGISRMLHTIVTGEIASKSAAGEWALERFGQLPILQEALAYRRGERTRYGNPFKRRREALDFVEMVIGEIART